MSVLYVKSPYAVEAYKYHMLTLSFIFGVCKNKCTIYVHVIFSE